MFICFFVGDFIFNMALKRRAEVLSSVPKCLMEKMHVIYKLCSDVSYKAACHEFNVNESTSILDKGSLNKTRLCIDQQMQRLCQRLMGT